MTERNYSERSHDSDEAVIREKFFESGIANWQRDRLLHFNESTKILELIQLTNGNKDHFVGWLERIQVDPDTKSCDVLYHAVCDCVTYTESTVEPDFTPVLDCSFLQTGQTIKAAQERALSKVALSEMLSQAEGFEQLYPYETLDPRDEAILHQLRFTREHPERWSGNFHGGYHQVLPLSVVIDCEPMELVERAHMLRQRGWINFDGERNLGIAA